MEKLFFRGFMNRHRFLKKGIHLGAIFASFPLWKTLSFKESELLLSAENLPPFPFSDEDLKNLLGIVLSRGGEFAEIYLEHTIQNSISLDKEKISAAANNS